MGQKAKGPRKNAIPGRKAQELAKAVGYEELKDHIPAHARGRPPDKITVVAYALDLDWIRGKTPGALLPTEQNLAQQYQTSRKTIRSVLAFLAFRRIIRREAGRRYRVAAGPLHVWRQRRGQFVGLSYGRHHWMAGDSFLGDLLAGIIDEFHLEGYDLLTAARDWGNRQGEEPVEHFALPSVRAVLMIGKHDPAVVESFKTLGRPLVAVDFRADSQGIDSICLNDRQAGEILARRFKILGHERLIALMESPDRPPEKRDDAWQARQEGFLNQWRKLGRAEPECLHFPGRGSFETAVPWIVERLRGAPGRRPTAAFIPSPAWLPALRQAAQVHRLRVPEDLTVLGCDHDHGNPELSAVRFEGRALGREAARHISRLMERVGSSRRRGRRVVVRQINGRYVSGKTHATAPAEG